MEEPHSIEPFTGFQAVPVPGAQRVDQGHSAPPAAPQPDAFSQAAPSKVPLVDQAKQRIAGQATAGKEALAAQIEGFAGSVQRSGEQFAGKQDWIARAIGGGAQELNSLAQTLRQTDVSTLLTQVQSFAKRQPGVFAGASLAAGFALARLGKVAAVNASRSDLPTVPEVGNEQR